MLTCRTLTAECLSLLLLLPSLFFWALFRPRLAQISHLKLDSNGLCLAAQACNDREKANVQLSPSSSHECRKFTDNLSNGVQYHPLSSFVSDLPRPKLPELIECNYVGAKLRVSGITLAA